MSDDGLWVAAALIGFFAIPVVAEMNPVLINGLLILILFSSLLMSRRRWLPYMTQLDTASRRFAGTSGGGGSKKKKG